MHALPRGFGWRWVAIRRGESCIRPVVVGALLAAPDFDFAEHVWGAECRDSVGATLRGCPILDFVEHNGRPHRAAPTSRGRVRKRMIDFPAYFRYWGKGDWR
jgi:hypothetical protein